MRWLLRTVALVVALCVAATLLIAWMTLDASPRITHDSPVISSVTADRTLRRLGELDPRRLQDGERRSIHLSADEVQTLTGMAASRLPGTRARALPGDGQLTLRTSTALPASLWLNVNVHVVEADGQPRLAGLTVGTLDLPASVATAAARTLAPVLLRRIGYAGNPSLLTRTLQGVELTPQQVRVDYALTRSMAAEGLRAMLPRGETERLAAYHVALRTAVLAVRDTRRARPADPAATNDSLPPVLQALFALAHSRGGDARAEQRSALLVLALHTGGRDPSMLIPDAQDWPKIPRMALTLHGREDLGQHFAGSALIAAHAGAEWANAIGLSKEVRDSRGGSGFSFTDLLADRAGTRLGERIAAGDRRLGAALAGGRTAAQLMPGIEGLAEFMPEAEFRRRFGGVGAPAYNAVLADIDARIDALDLYR